MRKIHRYVALVAVVVGLWVGATGTLIQTLDLHAILTHASSDDPDALAIRDGRDGPPNFQVIRDSDFHVQPLPAGFDFRAALAAVIRADRATVGDAPASYVELRMAGDKPVGQVASAGKLLRYDPLTGAVIDGPASAGPAKLPPAGNRPSLRNSVKNIHRLTAYGDWPTVLFFFMGLALATMIVTGLVLYFRLLGARLRMERPNPFWSAGGWWRTFHRGFAVAASLCLIVVVGSGVILSVGSLGVAWYRVATHGKRPGLTADASSPLRDAELGPMLNTTMSAFHKAHAAEPIKVVRLRYFAGMPQGVVVYGGPDDTRQMAVDTATGGTALLSGPGYPPTGQPYGWQTDQILKRIHRGDFFGMTGRWLSLLTGLSLLFLSVSGAVMYLDMWRRRRKAGRSGLFWP